MKEGKSYINDTTDFLGKLKELGEIPERTILVNADVFGLYLSICHTEGLEVLRKQYEKFLHKKVQTEDIIKMAGFALKKLFLSLIPSFFNKYPELPFVLNPLTPYACIFMDYIETELLKTQSVKP